VPNAPAPAPKPERIFCSNCGFPVRGARCDACGVTQDPHGRDARDSHDDIPTKQTQFRPYATEADADTEGLERAIDAYHNRDIKGFVENLVVVEGVGTARTAQIGEGAGWILTVRGALVFISLRLPADELAIEAPIARLPSRQRLPALRLALELCGREAVGSRVSLRGDLLLLRFTVRASLLTPPALRHQLREIGHLATRYAGLLTIGFDALPPIADDQRASAGFEVLGRAKKIVLGAGGSIRRSIPPPPPERPAPPERTGHDGARGAPGHEGARGAPGHDGGARVATANVRPKPAAPAAPRPQRREEEPTPEPAENIPAILAPMFSSAPASAPSVPFVPPPPPVPTMPDHPRPRTTASTGSDPRRTGTPVVNVSAARAPEIELETASRRPEPGSGPGTVPGLSASDRLCMLLRHAQSLASLTLEERPASMPWLVRSTVFRAVYDYKESVPDAVAHLYRCTGIGRENAGTGSGRGSSSQFPASEPALLVMERVIVSRALMPKEKSLSVEPMVSAAQAKEHVARYLSEIDRAPGDSGLRHFLALGALTELLVRTKLPPQTDQRLRDIVAHAQREGAKQTAIDLMMTALQRINS
jgi:hypothetical protein